MRGGGAFVYASASSRGATVSYFDPRLMPDVGWPPAVPRSVRSRFLPLWLCVRGCGGFVTSFLGFALGVGPSCGSGGFVSAFSCSGVAYIDTSSKLTMF